MPELIPGGVDIPIKLREELEEGKVIFFCGAGVSMPSGLPSFEGLAKEVMEELAREKEGLLLKAFEEENYDKVFNLLERPEEYNVEPRDLRAIVANKLEPKRNADITPHKTLLKLSHDQNGIGRLVTTNFDGLFEKAYKTLYPKNKDYNPDTCPRLPIPKPDNSWNSIVHLHGWLLDKRDPDHKNIVLSSADFGRAYLVERWASRFVTELFRHFRVVFIGYQVEDPVMKYLLDALAEARGEGFKSAYAFAPFGPKEGGEKDVIELWKSKGSIQALTYQVKGPDHSGLWQSLEAWAELHQGGFDSKCSRVTNHAMEKPDTVYPNDIENMLWAISQPDGNVAKVFADMNKVPRDKDRKKKEAPPSDGPPPPIEWLPIFEENGLLVVDQKGVKTPIVTYSTYDYRELSHVSFHLSRWLLRHMDKIEFLNWVLERGTILHHDFRMRARFALEDDDIKMPTGMRKVWNLILSEDYANKYSARGRRPLSNITIPHLEEAYTIQQYLNALCPIPKIKKNVSYDLLMEREGAEESEIVERPRTYADLDITFTGSQYPDEFIKTLEKSDNSDDVLIKIIDPLTDILWEIMDLFNYFEQANSIQDLSYIHMPSISPHEQNRDFNKWTIILELLRRSIEACKRNAPEALEEAMRRWQRYDYPIFKRLILHATIGGADE